MEDVRQSLSKLKKSFKRRLGGKKHAQDRAGADTAGERVSSSGSFLRPDPRIAVSGHGGEESRISTEVSQARSRVPSPHPEPVPADEARLDDPPQREVDVEQKGITREHSSLDLGIEGAVGGGPGREVKETSSPPSATPISPKQEPDSTWTLSS